LSEAIIVRTVAAFLNTRGGTLLIGVGDDTNVVGLERDYQSLARERERRPEKDRDRFLLHLQELLSERIGRDTTNLHIQAAVVDRGGNHVCVVHTTRADSPVYLSEGASKALYVRIGSSTKPLDVEEAIEYAQRRWPQGTWRRLRHFLRV
jgi:predicted HTH transcriptional regulator